MQPWGNSFLERTVLRKTILTGKPPGCVDQSACRHQLNVISRCQKVQNLRYACFVVHVPMGGTTTIAQTPACRAAACEHRAMCCDTRPDNWRGAIGLYCGGVFSPTCENAA